MNEEGLKVLPESIHEWDEVKNSETPEVFWDRIKNLRSKFGTGLFKPGEDAGDEDWAKFSNKAVELSNGRLIPRPDLEDEEQKNALYRALGRPDDPNGYEFAEIEGSELDENQKKFYGELGLKLNLTKSQLKALDETLRGNEHSAKVEMQKALNDEHAALKTEWGLAYDDRVHQAKKVARSFFPHLGDDPKLTAAEIKSFHSLFKQLGSTSTELRDQGDQTPTGMTPKEAAEKIAEIRGNSKHPYFDRSAPGHAAAKARMRELYQIKNGISPEAA